MELDVPERVHIAPVGYEYERVVKSAIDYKADRVVLIGHIDDGEEEKRRLSKITEALEDHGIEVEKLSCDIFDLYSSLGTIGELIMTFEDDEVYVNVSTGSKVTAIAGMIACMAIDATAYYAKATNYSGQQPEDIEFVEELPHYPIQSPEKEQVAMLYVINEFEEMGIRAAKGKLIHAGEHLALPFITEKDVQDKGKYRSLDAEIIEPLEKQGYISIESEGREKVVNLTEEGKDSLRAFRYLVSESDKERVADLISSDTI